MLKPWLKQCWCLPPQSSAGFVCAMEDVLEVYRRAYGEQEVLVCLDETSHQHLKETRQPRAARPGAVGVYDYEYERGGVSHLFMLFAPLEGWRRVEVTERRTRVDWARVVKQLVDVDYADKERIVLVMDNLNTHHAASLYEAFEASEARRIAERLEIHYTPKHGSWLNMAAIEIGVMARQCLARRIPDREVLQCEVDAWQNRRNQDTVRVDWRFTTEDARIRLKSLYPSSRHSGLDPESRTPGKPPDSGFRRSDDSVTHHFKDVALLAQFTKTAVTRRLASRGPVGKSRSPSVHARLNGTRCPSSPY